MTNATGGEFRGFVERDRPFIDDQPASKYGWEARSRWGSRPGREFGRACARGVARVMSVSKSAWIILYSLLIWLQVLFFAQHNLAKQIEMTT